MVVGGSGGVHPGMGALEPWEPVEASRVPERMRPLVGLSLVSLLTFSWISGCHEPPLVGPGEVETTSTAAPAVFVERRTPASLGVVETGPACPPQLAPAPSSFFRDHLLIRLPLGVESEQVPQQLWISRTERPLSMGCEPKLTASMFVGFRRLDTDLPLARDYLFEALDFPSEREVVIMRGSDADADVSMSISFPEHAAWGSSRVYVRTFTRFGHFHAVGFITDRSSYHQLEPVFAASATSMLAVPQ